MQMVKVPHRAKFVRKDYDTLSSDTKQDFVEWFRIVSTTRSQQRHKTKTRTCNKRHYDKCV
jgi:hypothetical protein